MKLIKVFFLSISIYSVFLFKSIDSTLSWQAFTQPDVNQTFATLSSSQSTTTQSTSQNNAGSSAQENNILEWFKASVPLVQSLAWPTVITILLLMYKSQIIELIQKISSTKMQSGKVEVLGTTFEFMNVQDTQDFEEEVQKSTGERPEIYGDPDVFKLLLKASSPTLSKSTKVLNTPNGCIFQVTTKELSKNGTLSVAEAITFVPGINVNITEKNGVSKSDFITLENFSN